MVRNFYIAGDVDGRNTKIGAGPARKDGGMQLTTTQQDRGEIVTAFTVKSYITKDNQLCTAIFDDRGCEIAKKITVR